MMLDILDRLCPREKKMLGPLGEKISCLYYIILSKIRFNVNPKCLSDITLVPVDVSPNTNYRIGGYAVSLIDVQHLAPKLHLSAQKSRFLWALGLALK